MKARLSLQKDDSKEVQSVVAGLKGHQERSSGEAKICSKQEYIIQVLMTDI